MHRALVLGLMLAAVTQLMDVALLTGAVLRMSALAHLIVVVPHLVVVVRHLMIVVRHLIVVVVRHLIVVVVRHLIVVVLATLIVAMVHLNDAIAEAWANVVAQEVVSADHICH